MRFPSSPRRSVILYASLLLMLLAALAARRTSSIVAHLNWRNMSAASGARSKNVVVLGGSYVGYNLAKILAADLPESHKVVLVEKNSHFQHVFAFPRFAVLPGHEHKAFIPYSGLFASSPPAAGEVVRARATAAQPHALILDRPLPDGSTEVPFEYLVLATGTVLPPPGTLHTEGKVEGVEYFRQHQEKVKDAQRIIILGGGAVGVQMATDIADLYPSKSVTLVHSRANLLPRFDPRIHDVVVPYLSKLGVHLELGSRAKVPSEGWPTDGGEVTVELENGKTLKGDLVIVATGQMPNTAFLPPALINSSNNFVRVEPTLQVSDPSLPHIFAVGDVADSGGPKAARPAIVQTEIVKDNILALIKAGVGKGEEELELRKYQPGPGAIHLTLGLTNNIVFYDPEKEGGEPEIVYRTDGRADMDIEAVWERRGGPKGDYHA